VDGGRHRPLYKGGIRHGPRRLGRGVVAHGSKFPRPHTQEPTVGGSLTAVGHDSWTCCCHSPWRLALSAVTHGGGGIVLINKFQNSHINFKLELKVYLKFAFMSLIRCLLWSADRHL
jgi:hypothetical protein